MWLIADSSDLRKPYAEMMPFLMQVKDLDGKLVPSYPTINVLGVTPGRRGLLYHHLFSSQAPDFVSEPAEVQEALETVSQALTPLKDRKTITWLLDSGFDDIAVWRTIWQAQEHLVCRVYHIERLVSFQYRHGQWQEGLSNRAVRPSLLSEGIQGAFLIGWMGGEENLSFPVSWEQKKSSTVWAYSSVHTATGAIQLTSNNKCLLALSVVRAGSTTGHLRSKAGPIKRRASASLTTLSPPACPFSNNNRRRLGG